MSSKALLPSLSESGWVDASIPVADILLSHVFCSDYSQTYIYRGHVASMAWMIRECQDDLSRLIGLIERTLTSYFNSYFDNTIVEVTQTTESLMSSKVGLNMYISFNDKEGVEHNYARMVEYQDLLITKVVDILNGRTLQDNDGVAYEAGLDPKRVLEITNAQKV